jgi:hypothetical protein
MGAGRLCSRIKNIEEDHMGKWIIIAVLAVGALLAGCAGTNPEEASFMVTIEVLPGSVTPIAPLAFAVHSGDNPLFTPNTADRINGLEALAEDGDPSTVGTSLVGLDSVMTSGTVTIPDGGSSPSPAVPGDSFSFSFTAEEGNRLSFATMYGQSNDLFFGPGGSGLALFTNGTPLSGDITDMIMLYDAGTEVNEEPGVGPNQAPRQPAPNTGPDEGGTVRLISDVMDGFTYPAVADTIKVTITAN